MRGQTKVGTQQVKKDMMLEIIGLGVPDQLSEIGEEVRTLDAV